MLNTTLFPGQEFQPIRPHRALAIASPGLDYCSIPEENAKGAELVGTLGVQHNVGDVLKSDCIQPVQ